MIFFHGSQMGKWKSRKESIAVIFESWIIFSFPEPVGSRFFVCPTTPSLLLLTNRKNLKLPASGFCAEVAEKEPLGLVHTSDGIVSGVGIGSARSVTSQCKSKRGIVSGVGSSTESESEGSEEFLFLPIPLPSCWFTLDQNFLPIPTPLPSLVWTSPYKTIT